MTPQERIVEQALRLFVTQGIKSVRMEDLARLAGVSKRVLYDMFEDKENLLYRVMLRYFEQNREHWRQQSAGAGNVLEELFMVLGDMMDRSEQTGRLMESLRRFYPALHERLRHEGIERNAADLRKMLQQGIGEGLFFERPSERSTAPSRRWSCAASWSFPRESPNARPSCRSSAPFSAASRPRRGCSAWMNT